MKSFLFMVALIAFGIGGTTLGIVAGYQGLNPDPPTLQVQPVDALAPGATMPHRATCEYGSKLLYDPITACWTILPTGQNVYFDLDTRTRIIQRASYIDLKDTVGDLLLVWGTPNGYTHEGKAWTFYWNDREAYIVPKYGLSIYSVVGMVVMGTPDKDYKLWPAYSSLPVD